MNKSKVFIKLFCYQWKEGKQNYWQQLFSLCELDRKILLKKLFTLTFLKIGNLFIENIRWWKNLPYSKMYIIHDICIGKLGFLVFDMAVGQEVHIEISQEVSI